jgi:hypothetical protein
MAEKKRGRGRPPKPKVKGKYQGKKISPVKAEQIRQTFMLTDNKMETARQCNVSIKTVYNVLNEPEDPQAAANRAKLAQQLATKAHVKAEQIFDSITEDDFKSGYLTDDDGNLVFDKQGRPIFQGPTLNQKAVSAAIMIDKLAVIEQYRQNVLGNENQSQLMLPEDIETLKSGIAQKVKKLRVMDIEFGDSEADQRAKDLLNKAQAELDRAEEIEAIELDFDNPGGED